MNQNVVYNKHTLKVYKKYLDNNMIAFTKNIVKLTKNNFLQLKIESHFAKMLKLTPKTPIQQNNLLNVSQYLMKSKSLLQKLKLTNLKNFLNNIQSTQYLNDKDKLQAQFIKFISEIEHSDIKKLPYRNYHNEKNKGDYNHQIRNIVVDLKSTGFLEFCIQILIRQKSFNKTQKKYITKFFLLYTSIFKNYFLSMSHQTVDFPYFSQFIGILNSYFTLIEYQQELIYNYIFLMNRFIHSKGGDRSRSYFINQKMVVDYILENKHVFSKLDQPQVMELIQYIGFSNLISNYPSKSGEFSLFCLELLQQKWYKETKHKRLMKNLVRFKFLNINHPKIMKGLNQLIKSLDLITSQDVYLMVQIIFCYMSIYPQIYIEKQLPKQLKLAWQKIFKYLNRFNQENQKDFTDSKLQASIFKKLVPFLYRASIWQKQFWSTILSWISKQDNYKKLDVLTLYTLFDIVKIDLDIIPKDVIQMIQACRKTLLMKHNFRIQDIDLVKTYYQSYGQKISTHYTLQKQIVNNIRSVSKTTVKSQYLIHFFFVDILLNDKMVIEINNQLHYIHYPFQNKKVLNLKSAFRKRILEKLGYNFMEVEVNLFSQGNYQLLRTIEEYTQKNLI